jgi:hypothetical protein
MAQSGVVKRTKYILKNRFHLPQEESVSTGREQRRETIYRRSSINPRDGARGEMIDAAGLTSP